MDLNIRNATSNYLVNEYGFEIIGSSIPKNDFNYYRRNFYLWIFKNVNKKLFYFLRDKVSVIKYIKERVGEVLGKLEIDIYPLLES